MCIAYLSLGHPDWPLLVAANRDEFHARPTASAAPWPEDSNVVAGRDLEAGGTWLGWSAKGRFALLTNYREPLKRVAGGPSRGALVRDFLLDDGPADIYLKHVARKAGQWAGFNLIVGDIKAAWYFSNRDPGRKAVALSTGSHVLSNHLLDTPWPKSTRLRSALDALPPEQWAADPGEVIALLHDTTRAKDAELPDTGLSRPRERLLSSPFIISPDYGTRCSTVLAVSANGRALFSEAGYDSSGSLRERHDWRLNPAPSLFHASPAADQG